MGVAFLLNLAKGFVDYIVVHIYKYLPSMRHVFFMHEHYRREVHLEEEDFKASLERRSSYDDLMEDVKVRREDQHRNLVEQHHLMAKPLVCVAAPDADQVS